MSLQRLLDRDATILTAASTTDRYGDMILDWSSPATRPTRVSFAQQGTTSELDHRAGTTIDGLATFDLSAQLAAGERVVIDGVTYSVVGQPRYAPTPRGPHHIEAHLKAVVG